MSPFDPRTCTVLDLIQEANREGVSYHLADDRLIIRRHRTRQDLIDAMMDRAEEVAAFLRTYRPAQWRTPVEEEEYRKAMADEMCLAMFGMEWQAIINIAIDRLADVVGEAWERYVARIRPLAPPWDGDRDPTPRGGPPTRPPGGRYSMRGGGRRG